MNQEHDREENHGERYQMEHAGRERVLKLYDWNENVAQMMGIYNKIKE